MSIKKHLLPKIKYILLIQCILFSGMLYAINNESSAKKLAKTRHSIAQLFSALLQSKDQAHTAIKDLKKIEKQIGCLTRELYSISENLQQGQKHYHDLQAKFIQLSTKHKRHQHTLAKQIQLIHELGTLPYIKLLFSDNTPEDIDRALNYYQYIYQFQQQKLNDSLTALKNMQDLKQQMQTELGSIRKTQRAKSLQVASLQTTYAKRNKILSNLRDKIDKKNKTLALLQHDEKFLAQKLAQLRKKTARSPVSSHPSFDNISPHIPVAAKYMQQQSSIKPKTYQLFINAELGSNVYAVKHGQIIFADWLRGYGLLIIIDHGNDMISLYGHNQTIFKKVGDWVNKGNIIALVGQSGGQAKPGLYFEVRKEAKPINLTNWFDYETQI